MKKDYMLGEIEKIIFKTKLQSLIHTRNGIKYIKQEDIDKLDLNEEEIKFIEKLLSKKNIILGATDSKDRIKKVKSFEYGEKEKKLDIPKYSTIDQYGEVDSEALIKKMDDDFIPKNLIKKEITNKYGDTTIKKVIPLYKVLRLAVSDWEFEVIMDHLNELGIKVTGTDYTLKAAGFDNYDYIRNYHNLGLKKKLSYAKQTELFTKYRKTKDKDTLNELFEHNLRLSKFIAFKYSYLYGYDFDETDITAQEGLFDAIKGYDPATGNRFSTYAYRIIECYLLNNRKELVENVNRSLMSDVIRVKLMVENAYGEELKEESLNYEKMVEEIAEILYRSGHKGPKYIKGTTDTESVKKIELRNILNLENYVELDTEKIDLNMQEEDIFEDVAKIQCSEKISEVLDEALTELERRTIKLRFGLGDNQARNLEEIAAIYSKEIGSYISKERVRCVEAGALRKLRHPAYSNRVRHFL